MNKLTGFKYAESVWIRFPLVAAERDARRWIENCLVFGLANNTVIAYARAIEGFLVFCNNRSLEVRSTTQDSIAQYLGDLRDQPCHQSSDVVRIDSGARLSNSTLQLRITAVRLFF